MSESKSAGVGEVGIDEFARTTATLKDAVGRVVVGQVAVVEEVLMCLFAGGHALLEGAPGLGKTLLVRTLAEAMELRFSRIQFTPDLMPGDIVGTNVVVEDERGRKRFELSRGPIFGQLVLADEINRATPKTQSALLEAMAENLRMNEWKMRGSIQPKSVKFLFIYIFPSISRLNL